MDEETKKFGRIYDACVKGIYRFVFLRVSSKELAEDITSETFLKGWDAYRSAGEEIKNPRAFLYRIAKNLVADHYRKNSGLQVVSADDHAYEIADPKTNLEQEAVLTSDMEAVRKTIAGLNEDYQNVIIWRHLDDMPIRDVAVLLDRSEEATRVLLHRAMKELKNRLA